MAKPRTRKTSEDQTADVVLDAVELPEAEAVSADEGSAVETVPAADDAPVALSEPAEASAEQPPAQDDPVETQAAQEVEQVAPARPQPPQVVKKGGAISMIFGGVVAAGLGAGAAIYALPQIPPQFLPASMQPAEVDTSAIDASIAAQAARVDALEAALAALPAPADPVDVAPFKAALDEASAKIDALGAQVATVESQMAALGDRALQSDPAAAAAMQQVQAEIAQMKALIDEGRDSSTAAKAQIEAAAEEAAARISGAEAEAAKLRAEAEQDAAKSRGKAAIAQLGVAISTGVEKGAALTALADAGIAVPDPLKAEILPLGALKDSFETTAREALSVSRKATAGDSALDKVGSFLIAQTGMRSLTPQEGDDPDAVLSRAGAAVDAGKLADALTEIAKLPAEGQEAMAPWIATAQAHIAATDALGQLAQSLN